MAQKQSILGRIAQLTRANLNALIDQAEDPQKMLDQMVRDFTDSIRDAQQATAQCIGTLRMLEKDRDEDVSAVREWTNKALAASQRADQLRAAGTPAEADRFDELAKYALQKQMQHEDEIRTAEPQIAAQNDMVTKLKGGLNDMENKLQQLKAKRDQLVARSRNASAQNQMADAVRNLDVLDPTSEISRFEEKVRREEALAQGHAELQASSLDNQFKSLDDLAKQTEIEQRLAALKSGGAAAIEK